ncbi:MAG: amidohydrolase family protein [Thermomicrobiales bacterium]|nr:amidohydrolase family protein [Thermomicrobiales bacterium]
MITRLTGQFVIGYAEGDHVIYPGGEVVYEGDTISFVGHGYAGPVDVTRDYGSAIVSPGFIDLDALADIDHAILDTWLTPDRQLGQQWSEAYFNAERRETFSFADEIFKRRYALVQLILNGITTAMPIAAETYRAWGETYDEFAATAEIAADLGLRMYLGPSYRGGVTVTRGDGTPDVLWNERLGEEGLEAAVRFVRDFDGAHGGLIRGALLPARIETNTLDVLRRTRAHSDELGCPVRLHAAQGEREAAFLRAWYGKRPLELLDEIDFLGPRTLIPHVTTLGAGMDGDAERDLERLRDHHTSVIHCPLISIRHGEILHSFDRYRQLGINLALGTDTFPPDMIRVMDYGSNLGKHAAGNQAAGSAADLFRAATLGGAHALGRTDLGRLAPGAKADITVVDLSALRSGPVDDPIRTMLYNTNGGQVRTVIINGRSVMEDRHIPGVDEAAMREQAQRFFDTYKRAYTARDYRRRAPEELFPSSFAVIDPPQ